MSKSAIVASSELGRHQQTIHLANDGGITLHTEADVEEIIEDAKAHRAHLWSRNFRSPSPLGTKAAVIPLHILQHLRETGILRDPAAFQRWLNEWPAFKATDGNAIPITGGA